MLPFVRWHSGDYIYICPVASLEPEVAPAADLLGNHEGTQEGQRLGILQLGNRPLWEQKPCWTMLQDHPCYDSAGYAVMTTVNALEAERTAVRYGPHLAYMVL